jgi:hypothetical protein
MDLLHYTLMATTAIGAIAAYAYARQSRKASETGDNALMEANNVIRTRETTLADVRRQLEEKMRQAASDKTTIDGMQTTIDELQTKLNGMGQAEVDTNGRLLRLGQALTNLRAAIKKARESGKLGPKARQEANAAIDKNLDDAILVAPKKVEANPVDPVDPKDKASGSMKLRHG